MERIAADESLLDALPVAVALIDSEGRVVVANRAFTWRCTSERKSPVGRTLARALDLSGDVERILREVDGCPQGIVCASASQPVRISSQRLVGNGAVPLRWAVTVADLSEGEADVTIARDTEERLLDCMPDGVLVHHNGCVAFANAAIRTLLGYDFDELTRLRALELVHPDDRSSVESRLRDAEMGRDLPLAAVRLARRDGTFVDAEGLGAPVTFHGQAAYLTVLRDVSRRKRLEAQLVVADRLAAVGRLAAGVAHEINNPLAYVIANVDFLASNLADLPASSESKEIEEALRDAKAGALRMAKIVHDMKALTRNGEDVREVDLHAVLDASIRMVRKLIEQRARFVTHFGEDAPIVMGDEGRLVQVFVNLLVNAAEAIPEGHSSENEIRLVVRRDPVGSGLVELSDSGPGIPPAVIERIFEPFFTTKPVGVGTGLGLSISHGIVIDLGGEIAVQSEAGAGATFRVMLPSRPRREDASAQTKGEDS